MENKKNTLPLPSSSVHSSSRSYLQFFDFIYTSGLLKNWYQIHRSLGAGARILYTSRQEVEGPWNQICTRQLRSNLVFSVTSATVWSLVAQDTRWCMLESAVAQNSASIHSLEASAANASSSAPRQNLKIQMATTSERLDAVEAEAASWVGALESVTVISDLRIVASLRRGRNRRHQVFRREIVWRLVQIGGSGASSAAHGLRPLHRGSPSCSIGRGAPICHSLQGRWPSWAPHESQLSGVWLWACICSKPSPAQWYVLLLVLFTIPSYGSYCR